MAHLLMRTEGFHDGEIVDEKVITTLYHEDEMLFIYFFNASLGYDVSNWINRLEEVYSYK